MPIEDVLQLGNPLLREKCSAVDDPTSQDVAGLVADLQDTLAHWRETESYGRGIAAPQIGVLKRVVFLNIDKPLSLINPEIVERSDETVAVWDACLSYLCIFFQVSRHRTIKVRYQDLMGKRHEIKADGDLSELLQHEIDHLDGVLAIDRMTDVKSMCTREEFQRRHLNTSPYGRSRGSDAAPVGAKGT